MNNNDKPSDDKLGESSDTPTKEEHKGPEQRKSTRREGTDRRGEIRFDLDNEDQRKSKGRRKDDNTFWN